MAEASNLPLPSSTPLKPKSTLSYTSHALPLLLSASLAYPPSSHPSTRTSSPPPPPTPRLSHPPLPASRPKNTPTPSASLLTHPPHSFPPYFSPHWLSLPSADGSHIVCLLRVFCIRVVSFLISYRLVLPLPFFVFRTIYLEKMSEES